MSDDNDITLQSYQDHTQEYINANAPKAEGGVKAWLDVVLGYAAKDARILELGSAYGRDADYIKSKGFTVECSDAVESFVELLQQKGHQVRMLNLLTDEIGGTYDLIFAQAVFLHFNPEQLKAVLQKIRNALGVGGVLAFSVKQGEGEVWSEHFLNAPRYFYLWQLDPLKDFVSKAGFTILELETRKGGHAEWIQIIVRKTD